MPSRSFLIGVALFLTVAAGACIGSLQQVFRERDVVDMKQLGGLWTVTRYGDGKESELPERPWVFRAAGDGARGWWVDVVDEDDRVATLEAVFFRIGKELYVETRVKKGPTNGLAELHQLPTRVPSRVEVTKAELKVFPLQKDALVKLAAKELPLREVGDYLVLDADADAWHAALVTHGRKLFDETPLIVLAREGRRSR